MKTAIVYYSMHGNVRYVSEKVAKELGENMTIEELQEMIEEADRDGDGEIGEEDFLKIMKKTNLF